MRRLQQREIRQNLRIASSTAFQPSGYDMTDRDVSQGIENKCSRGSFRSSWDDRIFKGGRSVDEEAAKQIERWFTKRRNDQLTVRIFRNLITRRDELDDNSLHDLLLAADKTIFGGRLSGRVRWEWSKGQPEYEHELLGTTALRPADSSMGGFETLIVLSRPLLQDQRFSRDLLLSAFLHELIHSYLFIQCGLDHAKDDGHTQGFRKIAKLIDRYFGQQRLHLCNMRANLDYFLVPKMPVSAQGNPSVNGEFWGRELSPKLDLRRNSSTDEGYLGWDRSPKAELSFNHSVDEGYGSRDPSPGSPGSPVSPDYYVAVKTGSENGHSKGYCPHDGLRFTTTH
jgi:hypothetical protein